MLLSIDSKIELSIDKNKASCVRKLYIYSRICPLVKPPALKNLHPATLQIWRTVSSVCIFARVKQRIVSRKIGRKARKTRYIAVYPTFFTSEHIS